LGFSPYVVEGRFDQLGREAVECPKKADRLSGWPYSNVIGRILRQNTSGHAYHEAGHAIVGSALGLHVVSITIRDDKPGEHATMGGAERLRRPIELTIPMKTRRGFCLLCAGSSRLAQALRQRRHFAYSLPHPPSGGDRLSGVAAMLVVAVAAPLGSARPGCAAMHPALSTPAQSSLPQPAESVSRVLTADRPQSRVDIRWAANDVTRARRYAAELIALAPDVILTA
jgi:hypothetical protein